VGRFRKLCTNTVCLAVYFFIGRRCFPLFIHKTFHYVVFDESSIVTQYTILIITHTLKISAAFIQNLYICYEQY